MAQLKQKIKNTLDEGRILVIGSQVLIGFQFRSVFEPGFEQLSGHRNVFYNMAEVSAFMESLHETAGTGETAVVIVQSGQARN
jgi:hypothetical protein